MHEGISTTDNRTYAMSAEHISLREEIMKYNDEAYKSELQGGLASLDQHIRSRN